MSRRGWMRRARTAGAVRAGMTGLGVLLASATVPLGAQEVERLSGRDVAIYNLAGRVEVVAGTGPDVVVRIAREGSDADRLAVETGRIGGRETLRVVYPEDEVVYPPLGRGSTTTRTLRPDGTFSDGRGGGDRVRIRGSGSGVEAWADLVVEVPAGRSTNVYLAVGEAEARGVDGDLRIDTGSGGVRASDLSGALDVDTGSGRVTLSDIRGGVNVDTGSGSIEAARLTGGGVTLDTGSGSITLEDVQAPSLWVDTGSGGIRMSGVRSTDVEVDTGSGSVEIELLTDVERLLVDTGSGSVTVTVPSDFGAEVELDTGSGRIEVDFPMDVRTVRRDELRGRIGDGAGTLSIDTGSGGIRLRRGG